MIVAGFGFRSGASIASLQDAYAMAQAGHSPAAHVATPVDKALAPLFQAFAQSLGLPVHAIASDVLIAQVTQTNAPKVQAARSTGSVAEAAALAAAGPNSHLLAARMISTDRMATCALAEGTAS